MGDRTGPENITAQQEVSNAEILKRKKGHHEKMCRLPKMKQHVDKATSSVNEANITPLKRLDWMKRLGIA